MSRRPRLSIVFLAAVFAARPVAALEWTEIARTGDPATGLPGARHFESFGVFERLGPDGEIYFGGRTDVVQTIALEPGGIYRGSEEAIELLVGYGDDPALDIAYPIRGAVNRNGDWAIADAPYLVTAPGCDSGTSTAMPEKLVRSTDAGGVETLVEMGTPIPGAPDDLVYAGIARWGPPPSRVFVSSIQPHLNLADSGALAFGAELAADPCSDDGREAILAVPPGDALALVALAGEPAPGMPEGFAFEELGLGPGALADDGRVTFSATLRSATEIASAVYRWEPASGVELVAMLREPFVPAPNQGLPVELPVIAATGAVAWFDSDEAFGPDGAGGVRQIFAFGDPVPGGPEDAVFWDPPFPLPLPLLGRQRSWIGASEQVAFVASMWSVSEDGPLGQGVFRADAGGPIDLVAMTGDVAPWTGGATLGGPFSIAALGDAGEIAFRARLDRPGQETESAVFLLDASGRIFPILQLDDLAALGFSGLSAATPDTASLGFDATFSRVAMSPSPSSLSGADGVFVATIPEPGARDGSLVALVLLAASALTAARARPPA